MTIPKKIHYCWFGSAKIPADLQKCMQTWQDNLPDYEIICWDEKKFNPDSVKFTREAYQAEQWAFVADYARLLALYTIGGIYLDTDIIVKKNFSAFLAYGFFSAVEHQPRAKRQIPGILMAVLGSRAGHPFIKDCMNWYESNPFILPDGSQNISIIGPGIYAKIAEKYGFQYKNELQMLKNNMVIFPSAVFSTNSIDAVKDAYAVHYCNASWQPMDYLKILRRNKFMRRIFGLKPFRTVDDIIKGNF
jgi:mannosyltransferase OCH1-like enzyme